MGKIELKAEYDVKAILSQLTLSQLEAFSLEIKADLMRRKADNPKEKETALLYQIMEECTLSPESLTAFHRLIEKRSDTLLTETEQLQLDRLIEEEELLRVQRVKLLGELAQLRGISLKELASDLGIGDRE